MEGRQRKGRERTRSAGDRGRGNGCPFSNPWIRHWLCSSPLFSLVAHASRSPWTSLLLAHLILRILMRRMRWARRRVNTMRLTWRNEEGSWFHRYGDAYVKERLVICNDEDTDGRVRVTQQMRSRFYLKTEQRSDCVGSQIGWLWELCR